MGNTFRFYKIVNGERGPLIGPELPIPGGVWHELTVDCKANQIHCLLNGKEVIPALTDNSFSSGKIGFWTKSDSVSYFADAKIIYTPREVPAQQVVRDTLKKYPKLLGLKIYISGAGTSQTRLIASKDEQEIGQAGGDHEQDVIQNGSKYYGKSKQSVVVTMPLHDRNGDNIAAARVIMKTFAGQTEQNALARAMPIVREMQSRITSLQDLIE